MVLSFLRLRRSLFAQEPVSRTWPTLFSGCNPQGDSYSSWDLVSLCASKILSDEFVQIDSSVFHEFSDLHVWKVVPSGALPYS